MSGTVDSRLRGSDKHWLIDTIEPQNSLTTQTVIPAKAGIQYTKRMDYTFYNPHTQAVPDRAEATTNGIEVEIIRLAA